MNRDNLILFEDLGPLMCPLQIINDNESLSSTLHGVNAHFVHHENYSINHKSETQSTPKKNSCPGQHIFTPF